MSHRYFCFCCCCCVAYWFGWCGVCRISWLSIILYFIIFVSFLCYFHGNIVIIYTLNCCALPINRWEFSGPTQTRENWQQNRTPRAIRLRYRSLNDGYKLNCNENKKHKKPNVVPTQKMGHTHTDTQSLWYMSIIYSNLLRTFIYRYRYIIYPSIHIQCLGVLALSFPSSFSTQFAQLRDKAMMRISNFLSSLIAFTYDMHRAKTKRTIRTSDKPIAVPRFDVSSDGRGTMGNR